MPSTNAASHGAGKSAGELGEFVRRVEALRRGLPAVAEHEAFHSGDEIPERAAGVAERNTAVHTSAAPWCAPSPAGSPRRPLPVATRTGIGRAWAVPVVLHEPRRFTHPVQPPCRAMTASSTSTRVSNASRCASEHPLVVLQGRSSDSLTFCHQLDSSRSARGAGELEVLRNDTARRAVLFVVEDVDVDHVAVHAEVQGAIRIEHETRTRRSCRPRSSARRPEDHRVAARHVLAAVVADASTTAVAPELRTQNRSPTTPRMNTFLQSPP